jgi:hypothetical protein
MKTISSKMSSGSDRVVEGFQSSFQHTFPSFPVPLPLFPFEAFCLASMGAGQSSEAPAATNVQYDKSQSKGVPEEGDFSVNVVDIGTPPVEFGSSAEAEAYAKGKEDARAGVQEDLHRMAISVYQGLLRITPELTISKFDLLITLTGSPPSLPLIFLARRSKSTRGIASRDGC